MCGTVCGTRDQNFTLRHIHTPCLARTCAQYHYTHTLFHACTDTCAFMLARNRNAYTRGRVSTRMGACASINHKPQSQGQFFQNWVLVEPM